MCQMPDDNLVLTYVEKPTYVWVAIVIAKLVAVLFISVTSDNGRLSSDIADTLGLPLIKSIDNIEATDSKVVII